MLTRGEAITGAAALLLAHCHPMHHSFLLLQLFIFYCLILVGFGLLWFTYRSNQRWLVGRRAALSTVAVSCAGDACWPTCKSHNLAIVPCAPLPPGLQAAPVEGDAAADSVAAARAGV